MVSTVITDEQQTILNTLTYLVGEVSILSDKIKDLPAMGMIHSSQEVQEDIEIDDTVVDVGTPHEDPLVKRSEGALSTDTDQEDHGVSTALNRLRALKDVGS